jgi:hypothetical protein
MWGRDRGVVRVSGNWERLISSKETFGGRVSGSALDATRGILAEGNDVQY